MSGSSMHYDEGVCGTVITIIHRMENLLFVCVVGNGSSAQEIIF